MYVRFTQGIGVGEGVFSSLYFGIGASGSIFKRGVDVFTLRIHVINGAMNRGEALRVLYSVLPYKVIGVYDNGFTLPRGRALTMRVFHGIFIFGATSIIIQGIYGSTSVGDRTYGATIFGSS